ncbi:hypothetical protein PUN28_003399 [Cardiocondyla obscurior]|uniref:Uncharacterized protein n=1 Tax=Cardiocondyla obscurior TaxID=286306 RepID=A0AAW2GNS1_9HYME
MRLRIPEETIAMPGANTTRVCSNFKSHRLKFFYSPTRHAYACTRSLSSSSYRRARVRGWRVREVMVSARFYRAPIGAYRRAAPSVLPV